MANYRAGYHVTTRAAERKLLRLDPCHLPQTICYKSRQSGKYFTAFLTENSIFIQQQDRARPHTQTGQGLPAPAFYAPKPQFADKTAGYEPKIFSPRRFHGIAACKITLNHGQSNAHKAFCLLLLHEQADYSVPLLISAHKDDVVLDWRLWADSYNLPMLIIEEGRSFRPLGGKATLKLFINDHKIRTTRPDFSLRCRGLSLNLRLVLANQVMLG
ncbi:MAG: hypothetical protein DU429_07355 [Candidatus Tokpelaia sp.]|nr:MAG: hypothetical protein DU430_08755 [Candidatus Tokpelaia sp.]KAA6205779.1 MAG: hypothetical protein DU429_07355 [Candidatus Tokpelaia sp.]